jgi:uncharacterized membrane protein (UPF0127 family)
VRSLGVLVLGALVIAACGPGRETVRKAVHVLPERRFPLVPEGAEDPIVAWVHVAATPDRRQAGLMHVEKLDPDRGMLFVYPEPRPLSFWMKNVRIPLSICFADAAGRIVRILEMEPGPEGGGRTYQSVEPALYALEMSRGWFHDKGIRIGDELRIDPEILAIRVR